MGITEGGGRRGVFLFTSFSFLDMHLFEDAYLYTLKILTILILTGASCGFFSHKDISAFLERTVILILKFPKIGTP